METAKRDRAGNSGAEINIANIMQVARLAIKPQRRTNGDAEQTAKLNKPGS